MSIAARRHEIKGRYNSYPTGIFGYLALSCEVICTQLKPLATAVIQSIQSLAQSVAAYTPYPESYAVQP